MKITYITAIALCLAACEQKRTPQYTPWGEPVQSGGAHQGGSFGVSDIQGSGEMIMLTISGPDSYYDYHGQGMGMQYKLCEMMAQRLGVSLRVEVCKTRDELVRRLRDGDGDIIAYPIARGTPGTIACGYHTDSTNVAWAVASGNSELADSINSWYSPQAVATARREERLATSAQAVHRHVYAPMLNASRGEISQYDHLFMRYAPIARWDWKLMAAQCYQESCFDPRAYSWAGARGLMQIMPATAAHLGLPEKDIFDPEQNIYAAARYIAELNKHFNDVRNPVERQMYALASYNGGYFHIRDAMRLAQKYGKNPYRWNDVAEYVLKLQQAEYYNDPVVKYGYMRGSETVGYVSRIHDRWCQYRGVARGSMPSAGIMAPSDDSPRRATKKHRFKL